jgi:sugar lactone lactonase YvrE
MILLAAVSCGDDEAPSSDSGVSSDDDSTSDADDDDDAVDDDDSDDDDTAPDDDDDDDTAPACWNDLAVGEKVIFANGLPGSEGIAFSPSGELYISASDDVAQVQPDGTWDVVVDGVDAAIGLTFDPDGSMYICDFGPSSTVGQMDGAIHKWDPINGLELVADNIDNPNFITRTPQGDFLISDDFEANIFHMTPDGTVTTWIDSVESPNGMVFSADGSALYVAGTFLAPAPVYQIDVDSSGNVGAVKTIANLETLSMNDGVAMDTAGMLYVTENARGKVVRVDTESGDFEEVATGMLTPASIAFGQAPDFDPCSIYVTELVGPRIWRVSLGITGQELF